MNSLIIRKPWIDKILAWEKTWELRGSNTKIRGRIWLIAAKSGLVYGTCDLVDSIWPLSVQRLRANVDKHTVPADEFNEADEKKYFAWVLANVKVFDKPEPYTHPKWAIIWVNVN
jgi:hypothetical protein